MKMVVCDMYQLARLDGRNFSNKHKEKKRTGMVVSEEWVKAQNEVTMTSGKEYVIDKEGTKIWKVESQKAKDVRAEIDRVNSVLAGDIIAETVKLAGKSVAEKKAVKKAVKKAEENK